MRGENVNSVPDNSGKEKPRDNAGKTALRRGIIKPADHTTSNADYSGREMDQQDFLIGGAQGPHGTDQPDASEN